MAIKIYKDLQSININKRNIFFGVHQICEAANTRSCPQRQVGDTSGPSIEAQFPGGFFPEAMEVSMELSIHHMAVCQNQ
jgi:hypothetical protein